MRIGQIVRITSFGSWHKGINACQGSIWAQVIEQPVLKDPGVVAYVSFIAADPDCAEHIGLDDWAPMDWQLEEDDRWEKVSPSKVPNWVWAEQARRNLTGSDQ